MVNVLNSPKHNYVPFSVCLSVSLSYFDIRSQRCIVGDRFIATLQELISPSLPSTSQAYGQCFSRCFALDHITKIINMYFFSDMRERLGTEAQSYSFSIGPFPW